MSGSVNSVVLGDLTFRLFEERQSHVEFALLDVLWQRQIPVIFSEEQSSGPVLTLQR